MYSYCSTLSTRLRALPDPESVTFSGDPFHPISVTVKAEGNDYYGAYSIYSEQLLWSVSTCFKMCCSGPLILDLELEGLSIGHTPIELSFGACLLYAVKYQ